MHVILVHGMGRTSLSLFRLPVRHTLMMNDRRVVAAIRRLLAS